MSKPRIYSGRAWIPPEWRAQVNPWWRRWWPGARIAVTGAVSRSHARDILAACLPLIEPPDGGQRPDREPAEGVLDEVSARRMMRRLRVTASSGGIRALAGGQVIHPYSQGVYLWRGNRPGVHVFSVADDRWALIPAGQFQTTMAQRDGRAVPELVAVPAYRSWLPPRSRSY